VIARKDSVAVTYYKNQTYNRKRTILLADDDPSGTELVLATLKELNIPNPIEAVEDGVAVLDYIYRRNAFAGREPGHPAFILLDLKMPKVNGLEVLRTIKADRQTASIPVVILTSSREESDLSSCYELGVNAYVVKPVDFGEFQKAVTDIGAFWACVNEPPPGASA
jgi:two-component system response regulator